MRGLITQNTSWGFRRACESGLGFRGFRITCGYIGLWGYMGNIGPHSDIEGYHQEIYSYLIQASGKICPPSSEKSFTIETVCQSLLACNTLEWVAKPGSFTCPRRLLDVQVWYPPDYVSRSFHRT